MSGLCGSMMSRSRLTENLVFVLGSQRSGTTWLANIFDSSPESLLFMEPFSHPYDIFPEFPEASYFLERSSPFLDHLLRIEMPTRLLHYKSLLFRRSMVDPKWFRLELWFAKLVNRLGRFMPCSLQNRISKFELLNLNRTDSNYPLYPKNSEPSVCVIKELRLAGKIPVLLHAFPEAYFIVIMRHPCATVYSILNWFEQGRLGELHQELNTYLEKIEVQAVSKPYRALITRCRSGGDLAQKVALYWRISYETMFKQLKKHSSVKYLVYEQLALHPRETIKQIFEQLRIPWSLSVEKYLTYSTSRKVEKPSAITTVHESAMYYRACLDKISETAHKTVLDMVSDSFLMSYFEPYYD